MAEWTAISGGSFDYVQGSTPSGAEGGETWLDTSVNPPEEFVYNGASWVKTAAGDSIEQNLDAAVSSRSSHDDPDPNGYIDAPVSTATGGIDWESKTYESASSRLDGSISVSGSGYLLYIGTGALVSDNARADVDIDGSSLGFSIILGTDNSSGTVGLATFSGPPIRFESSLSIDFTGPGTNFSSVIYVLD
jgi:hypothetical protein